MYAKRKLPLLLLLVAVLGLSIAAAGCGGDEVATAPPPAEPAEPAPPPPAETGATAEEPPAEEPPAGETIKVGLVTDTGGVDDRGFNQFSIIGLEQAEADLGIETRIYVSNSADDYLPNLQAAAEDGNTFVVAVGYLLGPSVGKAADAYPDVLFAGVDQFFGGEGCEETGTCERPNVLGMVYPTEEAGYLAGIVAAMLSKTGTISTVGGKKIPPVDNWIAGFSQAAKDTNPSIKLLSAYSQDFEDQAKCKEIALDQISQGSDVIFQVAGKCGLAVLDAACEKNVFAVGVDADQSFAGPCVVTSALKPLQSSVYGVIKSFVDGTFTPGSNKTYGVADLPDAALLAPYTDAVPQEVQDAVAAAQAKLASGEIDPPATIEEVK